MQLLSAKELLVESKAQQMDGSRHEGDLTGQSELQCISLSSQGLVMTQFSSLTLKLSSSVGLGGV